MEAKNATKIARSNPGIGADDRLSSLTDDIISHILSFLPTKYAVGTAVLSKRWKDLWTRVSSLDLDRDLVYKPLDEHIVLRSLPPDEQLKYKYGKSPVPDPVSEILARRDLNFCRFVEKVLSQHENLDSLRRFRSNYSTPWLPPDLWFEERELVFGPLLEEIEVMIWSGPEFRIPRSFYTLKNLTVVKLLGVTLSAASQSVFLPSVKVLHLRTIEIEDFKSFGNLLSGFPAVETAHLLHCFPFDRNENDKLEVSFPRLKNLMIGDYPDDYDDTLCAFVMQAPNLEVLDFEVLSNLQFMGGPFPCLHSARVDIGECPYWDHTVIGFLALISSVKEISLCRETLSHMPAVDGVQLPDFPNLTRLTIHTRGRSWVLHAFLNSASKLQSLVIDTKCGNGSGMIEWDRGSEPDTAPECLLSRLEEIEIKNLAVDENQRDMVAYLLGAGAVLKKLTMHIAVCYGYGMYDINFLASLLKLSRRSSSCEARLFLPGDKEIFADSGHETGIHYYDCNDMDDD